MGWAELIVFGAILLAIPGVVIMVSSAIRKTSPTAGFVALGWTILVYLVSSTVAAVVAGGSSSANGVFWITGTVLTAILASRGGYRWGLSWLWFILPGIGWWFILWARNNQLDARRRSETAAASVGIAATH